MQAILYQAFKHFDEYSNKKWRYRDTQYSILHCKAFGKMNLHYEIEVCQRIYNRVTTHNKRKYLVQNSLHQTLIGTRNCSKEGFVGRLLYNQD